MCYYCTNCGGGDTVLIMNMEIVYALKIEQ